MYHGSRLQTEATGQGYAVLGLCLSVEYADSLCAWLYSFGRLQKTGDRGGCWYGSLMVVTPLWLLCCFSFALLQWYQWDHSRLLWVLWLS